MNQPSISTLVVARPDRLGDVVLSSSCLPAVRSHFPHANLHWLIDERFRSLFHAHPLLDGLLVTAAGSLGQRVHQLRQDFRRLRPDALVLLQPHRVVELAARLEQVPVRAGFARLRCWPQFLTHPTPYRKSLGLEHESLQNFNALALLGVGRPGQLAPTLTPDPAARFRLQQQVGERAGLLPRCAALHLAAHGSKLRVPLAVFARLTAWLQQTHGLGVVLVGLETDPPAAQLAELAGVDAARIIDLRGPRDVAETAWLLSSVALFAARDSGPAHLAAAFGCPTLAMFPDVRPIAGPARWRPLGSQVEALPADAGGGFTPEKVHAAAARLLQSSVRTRFGAP